MTQVAEGQALVVRDDVQVPSLLVGTPQNRVAQATEVAKALSPVIEHGKLYKSINGRNHVFIEGWTTLGALMGVFPVTAWSRQTETGWEARVEARTLAGDIVGAAEAECSRDESIWKTRASHALRSMAQTRAASKALRIPLGFIMTLAGYDATPAEEMSEGEYRELPERDVNADASQPATSNGAAKVMTPAQRSKIAGTKANPGGLSTQFLAKCGGATQLKLLIEGGVLPDYIKAARSPSNDGWRTDLTFAEAAALISFFEGELTPAAESAPATKEPESKSDEDTARAAFWAKCHEAGIDRAHAHTFFGVGPEDGELGKFVDWRAKRLAISAAAAWRMCRANVEKAIELDTLLRGVAQFEGMDG